MDPLVVLYFMNLPSLQNLLLNTCEELLMKNRTAQELICLKLHKFPRFNNSKENGIVGGKLVRPAIPCRVCIWPGTRERLPTLVLNSLQHALVRFSAACDRVGLKISTKKTQGSVCGK